MVALVLKLVHIFASMFFLGFGMGSVFYRMRAYQSGNLELMVFADREVVRADWFFTVPSGVLLPLTGVWLVHLYGLPWSTPWVLVGLGGWALAGITWLPAAFLQVRMRDLALRAKAEGTPLPEAYHRAHRIWLILGFPSFTSAMVVLWAMIAKAAAFSF
jgi:uncharacterized membrane protein